MATLAFTGLAANVAAPARATFRAVRLEMVTSHPRYVFRSRWPIFRLGRVELPRRDIAGTDQGTADGAGHGRRDWTDAPLRRVHRGVRIGRGRAINRNRGVHGNAER